MNAVHRIKVMGRELQVRSHATVEAVHEVEVFVNDKLKEVAAAAKNCDAQSVAILTLMNIAEDYLALLKIYDSSRKIEQEKVSKLLKQIDLSTVENI